MLNSNRPIIPFSTSQTNKSSAKGWQKEITNSFKSLSVLFDYLKIPNQDRQAFENLDAFPLKVTAFYADLIKKNDINDPLLLQIIPQAKEQLKLSGYESDAVGDLAALKLPGLIHKYQGRVLLSLTEACGIHCRYCFRREFPYSDNIPKLAANSPIMQYLKKNQDIHEIILSGGDPLMLSDKKLQTLMQNLESIKHIKTIRLHTRMPSILPTRITPELLNMLQKSSKNIVMVLHINHAQEINEAVMNACKKLKKYEITLLNQSVMLNKVNGSVLVLKELSFKLFEAGVLPYYIHALDKVSGTAHFDLAKKDTKSIMMKLKAQLPGYLVPKFVEEIKGEASKTHIF